MFCSSKENKPMAHLILLALTKLLKDSKPSIEHVISPRWSSDITTKLQNPFIY